MTKITDKVDMPNIKHNLEVDHNTFMILMGYPLFKVNSKLVMEETALYELVNQAAIKAGFVMDERDVLLWALRDAVEEKAKVNACTIDSIDGHFVLERADLK